MCVREDLYVLWLSSCVLEFTFHLDQCTLYEYILTSEITGHCPGEKKNGKACKRKKTLTLGRKQMIYSLMFSGYTLLNILASNLRFFFEDLIPEE